MILTKKKTEGLIKKLLETKQNILNPAYLLHTLNKNKNGYYSNGFVLDDILNIEEFENINFTEELQNKLIKICFNHNLFISLGYSVDEKDKDSCNVKTIITNILESDKLISNVQEYKEDNSLCFEEICFGFTVEYVSEDKYEIKKALLKNSGISLFPPVINFITDIERNRNIDCVEKIIYSFLS